MINQKYFNDILSFPEQFSHEFGVSLPDFEHPIDRIIVCGMGGSALYVPLVKQLLDEDIADCRIDICSSYNLTSHDIHRTLIICASHSGNTEETLSCFEEARENKQIIVFASGGKLLALAKEHNLPYYQIPGGRQPRLSTGFFIKALLEVVNHYQHDCSQIIERLQEASQSLASLIKEFDPKSLATQLIGKTPIIYCSDEIASLALISKIKFNENSKTPAFAHTIPEMNHNEMCGWMGHTMHPHFFLIDTAFSHPRNQKRIDIMETLFQKEGYSSTRIHFDTKTVETAMLLCYHLMDFVSYYLAEAQNIDPEPVSMVEEFKQALLQ